MKTNKSTKECNAYNTTNADAIACGLMEAIEPNEQVMQAEEHARKLKQAEFQQAQDTLALLKQLDPNTDGKTVLGVQVSIEQVRTGGSKWRCDIHSGWKICIGDRWERRGSNGYSWAVVGDGTKLGLTAKQKSRVLEKIAEVLAVLNARKAVANDAQQIRDRYVAFIKNEENKKFLSRLTGSSYVSDYDTNGFQVKADGMLYYNGNTFSMEQWNKVIALREVHAIEMKNLKDKFTVEHQSKAFIPADSALNKKGPKQ
jgi:hypothetical protein